MLLLALTLVPSLLAYPPAPHHTLYGMVRDELGNPLTSAAAQIIIQSATDIQVRARLFAGAENGINYRLEVPMDAGLTSDLYQPTAMLPTLPFKLHVRIGETLYLPIEMRGDYSRLGEPGKRTRIDLTLGEDSDGDGLPDAWERAVLAGLGSGGGLADIGPQDDSDGDGLSNLDEYVSGNYAFDAKDGFALNAIPQGNGPPLLEFLGIKGRTYTILASTDMRNWTPVSFELSGSASAASSLQRYYATDVRKMSVRVNAPPDLPQFRFFKLMVE